VRGSCFLRSGVVRRGVCSIFIQYAAAGQTLRSAKLKGSTALQLTRVYNWLIAAIALHGSVRMCLPSGAIVNINRKSVP